MPEEGGS